MKWKTLDGEILDIKDMNENHIKNCIKQLHSRIIDPYDYISDKFHGSFTEICIIEDNKKYEKIIEEFEKELKSRL